jgi:hypothetical protein
MLGRVARIVGTAILGIVIGFFVAVSGFADGSPGERAIVIAIILLAYALIGLGLGFRASVWYGLGLALPGLLLLLYVTSDTGDWWYLLYAASIGVMATGGAHVGMRLGMRQAPTRGAVGTP